MINRKPQSGFTLIEVVIYLALFGIMFSGVVAGAYNIIETSGANYTRAMMQEEGEFLTAKINLAISNSKNVHIYNGQTLIITDWSSATSTIGMDGGDLAHIDGVSGATKLNNSDTRIDNLSFGIANPGSGADGIEYRFDLVSRAPNGFELVSKFASTAYIRK